jgi:hypothetical protein
MNTSSIHPAIRHARRDASRYIQTVRDVGYRAGNCERTNLVLGRCAAPAGESPGRLYRAIVSFRHRATGRAELFDTYIQNMPSARPR